MVEILTSIFHTTKIAYIWLQYLFALLMIEVYVLAEPNVT
jgi:hypothetical protein